jgi:hypothetical protein
MNKNSLRGSENLVVRGWKSAGHVMQVMMVLTFLQMQQYSFRPILGL